TMSACRVRAQKPLPPSLSGFQCTGSSRRSSSNIRHGVSPSMKLSRPARSTEWVSGANAVSLDVVGVLAELPVGDVPLEPGALVSLVGQVGVDEPRAEDVDEVGVSGERVEGCGQRAGQPGGPGGVVAVALQRGRGRELVADAEVDGGDEGG